MIGSTVAVMVAAQTVQPSDQPAGVGDVAMLVIIVTVALAAFVYWMKRG